MIQENLHAMQGCTDFVGSQQCSEDYVNTKFDDIEAALGKFYNPAVTLIDGIFKCVKKVKE